MAERVTGRNARGDGPDPALQELKLRERLAQVRHVVAVLSGKGGVGKSTVAANLAVALADDGRRVGLLDADMHGPSVPRILGLDGVRPGYEGGDILPVPCGPRLKVISMAFLLDGRDAPVIWRGPLKMAALRQFVADVRWGPLDLLVIDLPPGTGDEPLSVCQLIPEATGAIVVTTPQELSVSDVRRCISFCRALGLPVLGVIENMSGFVCPHCGEAVDVFGAGGGRRMAAEMDVPFLGAVPLDPRVVAAGDEGRPFVRDLPDSPATAAFLTAIEPVRKMVSVCPVPES
jgi:ATP-binding protein involved in chromosome partitioning